MPDWTSCGAQRLGKTATLVPSRWSFARRHMLGTGELMWISVTHVGTRGTNPRTTGADQTPGPRPVTLSEDRPLLAVSGSSRGGRLAVSSHVPWIVCGRLTLRGYRGPGPDRASSHLSRVLVEARVTPAVHLHGPAPLATPHHYP